MLRKLRLKFVLINMSIVTTMICSIMGLIYHFTRVNLEEESISMMQSIAENPLQLGHPNKYDDEVQLPYFALQLGSHGELIAIGGGYYDLSDKSFLKDIIESVFLQEEYIGELKDYNLRFYRAISPTSQCLVFVDTSSEQATLSSLLEICIFLGTISFIAFLIISILLASWAVKPVDKAWQQQRQFVSDASHELKTPLTVIMTNAELLQSSDYDEESRATFSSSILSMSQQMRKLVEQMLELARSDNAQQKLTFSHVNFSNLVSDVILPFEPVYFEQGLYLESSVDPNVFVNGGEAQLRQVLEILLDNAQKYSTPGGKTRVTLFKHSFNRCMLTVANEGETILPEKLKNLFERFYRADEARSRTGSFGLGLSIAQSIIEQHKGRIWAESRNGINSFHVELQIQ